MEVLLKKLQVLCGEVSQRNNELTEAIKGTDTLNTEYDGLIIDLKAEKKAVKAERAQIKGVKDVVALKKASEKELIDAAELLDGASKIAEEEAKKIKNTRFLMGSERAELDKRQEEYKAWQIDLKKQEAKLKEEKVKMREKILKEMQGKK